MIDATEFIAAATPANGSESGHKIAQVVGFFDSGAAQIQFAGESAPAAKEYPYLRSYKPQEGDYVLMFALADSYIILGAINFQVAPEKDKTDFDELTVGRLVVSESINNTGTTSLKNLNAENITASGDVSCDKVKATASIEAGSASISGECQANVMTSNGAITGTNISASGQVSANSYSGITTKSLPMNDIFNWTVNGLRTANLNVSSLNVANRISALSYAGITTQYLPMNSITENVKSSINNSSLTLAGLTVSGSINGRSNLNISGTATVNTLKCSYGYVGSKKILTA